MAEQVAIPPVGASPVSLRPPEQLAPVRGAVPRSAAPPTDGVDTEIPISSDQIYRTNDRLEDLRRRGVQGDDPATKPSFWQKAAEIFEFVLGFFPGIGSVVHLFSAIVGIGRLCFQLLSGENREQIDWTKELTRIGAHLIGVGFPMFGSISTAILNYWFDASENRQGVQVFGGLNYYMGDENFGRNKRGVVRDTMNEARRMFSGVFTPQQVAAQQPQPVVGDPSLNPALYPQPGLQGGPPAQGVISPRSAPRTEPPVRFAPVT